METIFQQAAILLDAGDTPVEVFDKLSSAFDLVQSDEEKRKWFRAELRGLLSILWPQVRKASIRARLNRRNA